MASSLGSLVLVLVALVPWSVASRQQACRRWSEFDRLVADLNATFKHCPSDCDAPHITKCEFPSFLIYGLRAVNHTLPDRSRSVQKVIDKLLFTQSHCKNDLSSVNPRCLFSFSAQSFFSFLQQTKQWIHSGQEQRRQL
uniref:Uncharacterized protein n=1 Tax=Knipowitschia caucasica TaxID=637954 RepID=A0AAV2MLY3_KNICA